MYSKLLFSQPFLDKNNDNALTAAEVYDLPMPHTALVFLSACETGFGSIADGEGVMSLSRAFAMSGVPTTVTTLWDIPTVAASDIFPLFYQYILAGKTPDEALRQAKSDYLQSALFVAGGNPLNWAGFVPYGDMARLPIPTITDDTPLSISPKIYWLVGILLTAAAAALLTVFRERIKSFFPKK